MALTRNRFPHIIHELSRSRTSKLSGALRAGAEIIEQGAKARVPVDQGDLRNAIHVEQDGPFRVRVVAGDSHAFYGHMVEHGTVRTPPRPFLVPATEAAKGQVLGLVKASLKRL